MDDLQMYDKYKDRNERQVKTTLERHPDHYKKAGSKGGKKSAANRGPEFYRLMGLKRHHPDWFDKDGKLIEGKDNE